uniref:Uncharacterized protein n=1 Tax=Rhipicephalus appendiculatus TaxID=34631 RepID=A0A131YFT5_RHIAP
MMMRKKSKTRHLKRKTAEATKSRRNPRKRPPGRNRQSPPRSPNSGTRKRKMIPTTPKSSRRKSPSPKRQQPKRNPTTTSRRRPWETE